MIANKKHVEYTRFLIERLRLVYEAEIPTAQTTIAKPMNTAQLDRLLKCIASEGYGL